MILAKLLFILSVSSPAQAVDRCTVDGMTNRCEAFSPTAPARIIFADGTSFVNPNATELKSAREDVSAATRARAEGKLEESVRLAQLLDRIPSNRMSERFKQMVLSDTRSVTALILGEPIVESVKVVWPPTDEKAVFKSVPWADFKAARAKLFTPQEIRELRSIAGQADAIDPVAQIPISPETPAAMAARLKKVEELIRYSRDSIISLIQKGRPLAALTPEEKALVEKISSIKFLDPQSREIRFQPECQGILGNAFYRADLHVFTICPAMLNNPDAMLVAVIAHEFTHSIDSCESQGTLYEIDRDKIPVKDPPNASRGLSSILATWRTRDPRFSLYNIRGNAMVDLGAMPDDLQTLEQMGVLKVKTPGVPFERYPFAAAYQCLTTGQRAFDSVQASDVQRFASDVARAHGRFGQAAEKTAFEKKLIQAILNTNRQCWKVAANDQMQEVMSDWVAAQVMGRYLEQHPPKAESEKLAAGGFFAALACTSRKLAADAEATAARPSNIITDANATLRDQDPHPPGLRRFNDIYMAEPRTRRALGCEGAGPAACFGQTVGTPAGKSGRSGAVR